MMQRACGRGLVVSCLLLVLAAGVVCAATVETRVTRVALFKNGLAFFMRSGELPGQAGEIEIGPLPAASHGTFWLGWDPQAKITNLASREVEVMEGRLALTIPELLKANVGKRVRLEFASEFRPAIEGVLRSFPEPAQQRQANPYMAEPVRPAPPNAGQLLMIETAGGMVAINPSSVDRIAFLEAANTTVADEYKRVAISGMLAGGGGSVSAYYLAKGMTWVPSYLMDISQAQKGRLTAKACIINDIEDLKGASVELVTGFPYLEFSEIISPLAKKEDLAGFLNALSGGASQGRYRRESGAMMQQVMANMAYSGETMAMPDYGAAAAGATAEDLFFYPLENVTLARGAVGYYPLFTQEVPYEHIYEWDIPDYMDDDEHYRRSDDPSPQIVWHSLRLTNGTGMPWTTAPAMTMEDGRLLGQAMLNYTPAGGQTMLKITQALGIKAEELELEVDRQVDAMRAHGWTYDLVTVSGTLAMRSHMDKAIKIKVTKLVTGQVSEHTPAADVQKLAAGLQRVNPRSRLTWEIEVKPGENVEITYQYKVYVRR